MSFQYQVKSMMFVAWYSIREVLRKYIISSKFLPGNSGKAWRPRHIMAGKWWKPWVTDVAQHGLKMLEAVQRDTAEYTTAFLENNGLPFHEGLPLGYLSIKAMFSFESPIHWPKNHNGHVTSLHLQIFEGRREEKLHCISNVNISHYNI